MNRWILILAVAVGLIMMSNDANAQQEILTTQWAYNKLTVNPAYTGAKEKLSIRALHRQQWVGIDGRPITTVINAHSPFLRDRIAVGLSYTHDKLGVISTHILSGSYAYRLPFENGTRLSFGISAGVEAFKLDATSLSLVELGDPIKEQDYSKVNFKSGAGVYYYGSKFFVGFSTPNFIPNKLYKEEEDFTTNGESKQSTHIYAMAGYAFELAEKKVIIKPQVLFKTVVSGDDKSPFQMDFNLSLVLFERLILGGTFRTTIGNENEDGSELENIASVNAMMGIYITKQFFLSYSYDFTMGELQNYDSGSHEVMLGFDLNFKKLGSYTPRYF